MTRSITKQCFEYEDASKPAGSVGQVMEPGYTLHDQPLRPAKVGVTKGGEKPGAAPDTVSAGRWTKRRLKSLRQRGGTAYEDDKKAVRHEYRRGAVGL